MDNATTTARARRSASSRGSAGATIEQLVRQQQQRCDETPSLMERIHLVHQKAPAASSHAQRVYVPPPSASSASSPSSLSSFERLVSLNAAAVKPNQSDASGAVGKDAVVAVDDGGTGAQRVRATPALHTQRRVVRQHSVSVADFERKYAKHNALLRYTLEVIREKRAVRRLEIPKNKYVQRKIDPKEGVLYLVYDSAPPCSFRNVYWLQFTDEASVVQDSSSSSARDFFTLGSLGFTHFHNGAVTEFFELADWVDEKRAFDRMTMMRGLQRIQQMLFFFSWKRKTVRNRHLRTRAFLACSLFACHAVAGHILLQLRAVCTEIEEQATWPHLEATRAYTLDQYLQVQRERLESSRAFVCAKVAAICDLIARATQPLAANKDDRYVISTASASVLSAALQASSLRERMFGFLRLADLLVGESIFRHFESFLLHLHTQVCGGDGSQRTLLPQQARDASRRPSRVTASSSVPTTKLYVLEPTGVERCEFLQFAVRCALRDARDGSPMLYAHVVEAIDLAQARDAPAFKIDVAPSKTTVFEALHSVIGAYMAAIDETPFILMDTRFSGVLAPFAPHYRSVFIRSLGKPSAAVLQACSDRLQSMRQGLEAYFWQLEGLRAEHLQCLESIRSAELRFASRPCTNIDADAASKLDAPASELDTVSAQRYEDAQTSWTALLAYATSAPPLLQVGALLVDQRAFVGKIRAHASRRLGEMDHALPGLYELFLRDLLREVDGKIERVTKIPTTFKDANVWLTHVTEMLPSHAFRQRFDAKCANVAKLRTLLRERRATPAVGSPAASTLTPRVAATSLFESDSDGDALHKLELEWESTFETLIMCLARVQDRDSEHRRSFYDLAAKTEEYVSAQLDVIKSEFLAIPLPSMMLLDHVDEQAASATARDSPAAARRREKKLTAQKDRIVEELEVLVELDTERKSVERQFALYEGELRAVTERQLPGSVDALMFAESSDASTSASLLSVDEQKLPSELLLQNVVTALDLRKWFESWTRLVAKWETTPLSLIHAGMVLNRVRQFRRRLLYAVSRLFHPTALSAASESRSSASPGASDNGDSSSTLASSYLTKDLELARAFDASIEQAAANCRIFQALSSGAFTDERWQLVDAMMMQQASSLGGVWSSELRPSLTLRMLRACWRSPAPPSPASASATQVDAFMALCDQAIVEAKVRHKIAQVRQRLAQLRVVVIEANYNIRCDNMRDVLIELEDLLLSGKLYLHEQNPALDAVLAFCSEVEHKVLVCEHIERFQSQWRYVCEMAKLHDMDEYFTSRKASSSVSASVSAATRVNAPESNELDESVQWLALKTASQSWNDRIRRAFCQNIDSLTAGSFASGGGGTHSSSSSNNDVDSTNARSICSLDDLVAAFDDFEFEQSASSCEAGAALLRGYFDALREIAPRLFALSDGEFLQLLVHEDSLAQVTHSLALCFPHVDAFTIGSSTTRSDGTFEHESAEHKSELRKPASPPAAASLGSELGSPFGEQTHRDAGAAAGPIIIRGVESAAPLPLRAEFNLPVLKIGRVKFWFRRLEEEMAALVTSHVRRAVHALLADGATTSISAVLLGKRLCQTLLPQAIALALQLRFRYHVDRAFAYWRQPLPLHAQQQQQQHADECSRASRFQVFDDLLRQMEAAVNELVLALHRPPNGLSRCDPRVESVVLLCSQQLGVARHIVDLLHRGERDDDALCLWTMQLKLGVSLDVSTRSMTKAGRAELESKLLGFHSGEPQPTHAANGQIDSAAAAASLLGMQFHAQVAHVELPIGHEYVGCSRLAVVTPLAERCMYAIFSAMRTHSLVLAVPHAPHSHGPAHFSSLTAVSQVLMKPSFTFQCGPKVQTLDIVNKLIRATVALGGVLSVHDFLALPSRLRSACRESLVQAYHRHHTGHHHHVQAVPVVTSPRAAGSVTTGGGSGAGARSVPPSGFAAMFVPIMGNDSLRASGLLDSLQTPFRSLALVVPSITYVVEATLLLEGFSRAQAESLQLGMFFESFAAAECELARSSWSYALVPSVVKETRRIHASFRAVTNSEQSIGAHLSPSPSCRDAASLRGSGGSDVFSAAVEQCICERAVRNVMMPVLSQQHLSDSISGSRGGGALARRFELLVAKCFRLGAPLRMVADRFRGGAREEDLAGALAICLEHSHLARSDAQIDIAMDMWRAMQHSRAVLLHGPPGSGKTTCIRTLHHALCALEYTDAAEPDPLERAGASHRSELVVMNPSLFSYDELYGVPVSAHASRESAGLFRKLLASSGSPDASAYSRQPRTWILIDTDGRLNSSSVWLEPLLALLSDNVRWLHLLDGCSVNMPLDVRRRVRLIFEVVDLRDVTPRLLVDCWSACVPASALSHPEILQAWRSAWEQRLALPVESRAAQNLATVFATTELLVSTICVKFIRDEMARVESSDCTDSSRSNINTSGAGAGASTRKPQDVMQAAASTSGLRLGYLSMNHMTQTTLKMLSSLCLTHHASLEELSPVQASLLACFAVLWGFSGHLGDAAKHKLELFVRAHGKDFAQLKHVCDLPGSLFSGDHFASVWEMLYPLQHRLGLSVLSAMSGVAVLGSSGTSTTNCGVSSDQLVYDASNAQFVVLVPSARSLVRLCSQLLRSSQSFLFTGASATGKTSLLRLLQKLNEDDEAAEVMVDASIDQRRSHGVLNWLRMPAAWFCASTAALDASGARCAFREEEQLFAPRTTHSMLFLDDLGANVIDRAAGDNRGDASAGAQEEFVRFVLDHQVAFSRREQAFRAVDKDVGAAMRVESDDAARMPASLVRLMRHFAVFQVPSYDRKQLLSIFRAKFHARFPVSSAVSSASSLRGGGSSTSGGGGGGSAYNSGERLLSMEETVLRASVDLAVEMSAIQLTVRTTSVDAAEATPGSYLVFNLHHASALLGRTLAFAESLRERNISGSGGGGGNTTSLLTLGKLHQCWMSEIRNMFLANASAAALPTQPAAHAAPVVSVRGSASCADSHSRNASGAASDAVAKVWTALRLISEKYFSVSLRDDPRALTGVETVFFTLQLASKYSQLAVVEQLAALREIMTTNASASSSTRMRNHRGASTGINTVGSAPGMTHSRESTSEMIQRILLQLAASASWSSSSPPARSYHADDLSTLEVKLLLGSSYGLCKTLHLLHALDEQRHVVISARASRGIAECLLRFACDSHGLQVKRLSCRGLRDAPRELDEQLRAILHSAGIQNERTALWVDCDASGFAPAGAHALVDLVRELCLNQVPSLLFRSGALRDAALLSFVQSRQQLELASDADIFHDFVERVQRNLRLCLFADNADANAHDGRGPQGGVAAAPTTLLDWLKSRERFQWFCFSRVERVDVVMLEIAQVAVNMLELAPSSRRTTVAPAAPPTLAGAVAAAAVTPLSQPTPPPHSSSPSGYGDDDASAEDTSARALIVSLCHRVHVLLTHGMVVPMSECFQLTYFLSLLKNLVVLHQRRVMALEVRAAQHKRVLSTLATKRQLSELLTTRETALSARLVQLRSEHDEATDAAECHREQVYERKLRSRAKRTGSSDVSDDGDDNEDAKQEARAAAAAARRKLATWQHRARCEELAVAIAEVETELSEIARFLSEWRDAASVESECVVKWTQRLDAMRSRGARSRLLARVLLQSALMAYSYVASLPASKFTVCVGRVKELLAELEPALSLGATPELERSITGTSVDTDSEVRSGMSSQDEDVANTDGSGDDCDSEQSLARALWRTQFRFLRHSEALTTIELADSLCDRLPVFVDPSGLLQRFFLHFFSGHSLRSSAGTERDAVWRDASLAVMIVTCDDERLEAKLHEAQRRNVPVLLINFDLTRTLPVLLPFLEYLSGHRRQPVLSQITVQAYDIHLAEQDTRRNKKKQPSATTTQVTAAAKAALASALALPSTGDALKAPSSMASDSAAAGRHTRKKFGITALSTEIAAAAVAAAGAAPQEAVADASGSISQQQYGSSSGASVAALSTHRAPPPQARLKGFGFQLYAVSSTPVPIQTQHTLAMSLAVFHITLEASAIGAFFHDVWMRKSDAKLHHELHDVEKTLVESAHRGRQLESRLFELLLSPVRAPAPLSLHATPWVRCFFEHYELAPTYLLELGVDMRRHHTERFLLRERRSEITKEAAKSAWVAHELVAVAASTAAVSTLAGAHSQLYARSLRWLEFALEQQLHVMDARSQSTRRFGTLLRNVNESNTAQTVVHEIMQQLVSGFASTSHRQIFVFLLAIEREAQRGTQYIALRRALDLLSGSSGNSEAFSTTRARPDETSGVERHSRHQAAPTAHSTARSVEPQPASGNSTVAPQMPSQSMVDRFRRKVRLCAFIFDHLSGDASGTTSVRPGTRHESRDSNTKGYTAAASLSALNGRRPTRQLHAGGARQPEMSASTSRQSAFQKTISRQLSELLASVDALWSTWRERKRQTKLCLQRVLLTLGIHRGRMQRRKSATAASDALLQASSAVALVTREDVNSEYAVTAVARELAASDPKRFEKHMARLLITKMHFPDLFADAMDDYIDATNQSDGDGTARAAVSTSVALPLSSLAPRESKRAGTLANRAILSAATALVGDIVPLRSHEHVHLPSAVVAYDVRKRNCAELMLAAWTQQASSAAITVHHWDATALRARFTALVSSKDRFVVELLAADDFDCLLALVSQLINQHAQLAPPEWFVLLALPVASRVRSSFAPLVPKSVLARAAAGSDASEVTDSVKCWLTDRGVSEAFAMRWVVREFAAPAAEAADHSSTLDASDASAPALSDLKDVAIQFKAIDDLCAAAPSERAQLEDALIASTTRTRQPQALQSSAQTAPPSTAGAATHSRAPYSAELLSDLLLLRRSMALANPEVLVLADATATQPSLDRAATDTAPTTFALDSSGDDITATHIPERMVQLCAQIGSLFALLREEIMLCTMQPSGDNGGYKQCAARFVPWYSFTDEFNAHLRAFTSVNTCFESLLAQARTRDTLSITAQQQITSLTNGLIPFEWMVRAFTHTVGPSTSISVAQLVLLVTCRLGMLVGCFCDDTPVAAINLAALSDARAFLAAMKVRCAEQWRTPVDSIVLVLDVEALTAHDEDADDEQRHEQATSPRVVPSAPPLYGSTKPSVARQQVADAGDEEHYESALSAALVRDSSGQPCGILVDGLVVVVQNDSSAAGRQTHLHALPLCRLYCSTTHKLAELERLELAAEMQTAMTDAESSSDGSSGSKANNAVEMTTSATVKTVPLVVLPSLSPYQQPPRLFDESDSNERDAVLDASVHLHFSLATAIPALAAFVPGRDTRSVAFAIGAPIFPDDDDDDQEIS